MTNNGMLYRSNDTGAHWTYANKGIYNTHIYCIINSGTNLFVGTDSGVYQSTNMGDSWNAMNTGLTNNYVQILAIYDSTLFAGTEGSGVWKRPLSEFTPSAVLTSNQPSAFHLAQNYPNPFSESTTIRFDLPERAFVSLKVYDITGREVAVLANETLDAGSYSRTFNAEGLPSGTYICHLEAGEFRQERTLFLLR